MRINLADLSYADLLTGLVGGAGSVLLVAFVGRYLAEKLFTFENGKIVGFCLAAGLVLGRGTIIRGSPSAEEVELAGRSLGSLITLGAVWLVWFKGRVRNAGN